MSIISDGNYAVQVDAESAMHLLCLNSCHKLVKPLLVMGVESSESRRWDFRCGVSL